MKALRQMGSGFIIGVISLLLVIGGISLSLAEPSAPEIPPTPSPIPTTFAVEFASPFPSPTLPPVLPTDTSAILPTATATLAVAQPVDRRAVGLWKNYARWLEPGEVNPAQLQELIQPFPAEAMTASAVSTLVNRPENDLAACIQPA